MISKQFKVLDCLADPVLVINDSYKIVFANQAMAELCGVGTDVIIGSECYRLFHQCPHPCKDCEEGHPCSHSHVFSTGTPMLHQHQHMMPDGTSRIFDMTASPLRDENGYITHVIQVMRDITRQEELRAMAEAKQFELERLFSLVPFFIIALDTDLRVRWINPTMEQKTGLRSSSIEDRHCYDLWGKYAKDQTKKGSARICDGCTAKQTMQDGKTYAHERLVEGRIFDVITVPLSSFNGTITGVIEFGFDITARKEAENELKKKESRLRILFENLPTPLGIADFSGLKRCLDDLRAKGVDDLAAYLAEHREKINKCLQYVKILDINEAALSLAGLPSKEAFFANIDALLNKIPLHENSQGLLALNRGEKSWSHELTLYSPANEKRHAIFHWTVEPGYETTYERVLFTVVDITYRKNAETAILANAGRMRLLHEIDQAILEAGSAEEIGHVTLTLLQSHLHCSSGCIILFDLKSQRSSILACTKAVPSTFCADKKLVFDSPRYLDQLHAGHPFIMENLSQEKDPGSLGRKLLAEGFHFFLSVPLLTKSGLLGALNLLDTAPRALPAEQISFISQLAPFLAVAIQNAKLFAALNRRKEELRTLTRRLAEVEETERRRLAVQLHDEVGQNLSALAINLDTLDQQLSPMNTAARKRMDDSVALIDRLTGQIRTVMADLRPPVMDDYGLLASLQWLADTYSARTGIQVQLRGREAQPRLSAAKEIALFRVAQEALINTAKHAQATSVVIDLFPVRAAIRLVIRDNGRGFDHHAAAVKTSLPLGLLSMRERMEAFNGHFSINSRPGVGTTLTVEVPA